MSKYLGYRDGGKTNEEGLYRFIAKLFKTGVPGLDSASTTMAVSQRAAGANMSVDIAIGDVLIPYSTYLFTGFTDAIENVSVDAADPSNGRKDIVVAYVDLSVVDDTVSNNPDALKFKVVAGTPSGSPAFPDNTAIQASVGGSNPWVELGGITLLAADTSVTDGKITDRRKPVSLMARLWGGASNTIGHLVPNVADDTIALLAAAQTLLNKTLTAPIINNPTISGFNGWQNLGYTPNAITANASVPKVFDLVFNTTDLTGTLSNDMKLQLARTVAAPSRCTDLESSSSQYYSKTSPAGLSFTTAFTCSAWIKLESYGAAGGIIARRNADTEGWNLTISSEGKVIMSGLRIASNNATVSSYASVPLNKWVHVAASMDLAGATGAVYIDGIAVASNYAVTGTATALVQGTTALVVGASKSAGTEPFDGKIAQAAVFSAVLSAATILAMINRTLSGAETNLVSAYSFNNSINDLNANANNLTAHGSAVATNADSPFANAVAAGSLEYAEVLNVAFSTNTTVTVRVPDGCQIPTSGGVSSVLYSTQSNPYGLPYFSKVLGQASIGSQVSTQNTSVTQVAGLSAPVYVPANAKVKVSVLAAGMANSTAGNGIYLSAHDGTVGSTTRVAYSQGGNPTAGLSFPVQVATVVSPTSGVRTYNAGFYGDGGGTNKVLLAAADGQASLVVELV